MPPSSGGRNSCVSSRPSRMPCVNCCAYGATYTAAAACQAAARASAQHSRRVRATHPRARARMLRRWTPASDDTQRHAPRRTTPSVRRGARGTRHGARDMKSGGTGTTTPTGGIGTTIGGTGTATSVRGRRVRARTSRGHGVIETMNRTTIARGVRRRGVRRCMRARGHARGRLLHRVVERYPICKRKRQHVSAKLGSALHACRSLLVSAPVRCLHARAARGPSFSARGQGVDSWVARAAGCPDGRARDATSNTQGRPGCTQLHGCPCVQAVGQSYSASRSCSVALRDARG